MKNACFDHWNSRKKNIQYALQGRTVLKIGPFYYAIRKKQKSISSCDCLRKEMK